MASLPPNSVARSVLACSREQAKAFSFGLGMPSIRKTRKLAMKAGTTTSRFPYDRGQLRCSMQGLSHDSAHQAGLWQDASIHGDPATPSLTEKIERIAAS
ncbi:hypothetical protein [Bradyrhizobium sp.]|uniref:hypothetical protein n=1 Tax=Bradyrhizobium sp. TaxID=376 RepID=UPI002C4C7F4B|nr:hypothetical protein [Bradyrhizobium sp.]HWX59934.1 hypothetical protein [Bradyrhizobium sp.]